MAAAAAAGQRAPRMRVLLRAALRRSVWQLTHGLARVRERDQTVLITNRTCRPCDDVAPTEINRGGFERSAITRRGEDRFLRAVMKQLHQSAGFY